MAFTLESLAQDLRYAIRTLGRAPSFTLAVLITLALGIGANTAVFAVVDAVLLQPLPYPNAEEIVVLQHRDRRTGTTKEFLAVGDYVDLSARTAPFADFGTYASSAGSLRIDPGAEPSAVRILSLSPGSFRALRPTVVRGRGLEDTDRLQGAAPVALLTHDYWVTHFASDPAAIGRTITVGSTSRQIVGVVQAGFSYPANARTEVIVPSIQPQMPANRRDGWITALARLKPGETIESANAELARLSAQWERDFPESNRDAEYFVIGLRESVAGNARLPLMLLLAAVGLLLLIACANVANLVLARSIARRQETSVRLALGASVGRITRQLLTENLLLASVGGLLGVGAAHFGARAITALMPSSVTAPGLTNLRISGTLLLFAAALVLLTATLLSFLVAAGIRRRSARPGIETTRTTMSGKARRAAGSLVVAEVALAVMLLVGAGLVLRSFARLMSVDAGFRMENVLTYDIQLPSWRFQETAAREGIYARITRELEALPGVRSVGAAAIIPLTGNNWTSPLDRVDKPLPAGERPPEVGWQQASGTYFSTLGIPLIAGRLFDATDRPGSPPVLIVSEEVQRRYFDGQSPIGKRLRWGPGTAEIIGVVGNIKRASLRDTPRADLYAAVTQAPQLGTTLFIRTAGDPIVSLQSIQRTLRTVEPQILLRAFNTLEGHAAESIRDTRLVLWLLGLFALTALALAAVGIYGVTAYVVRQRTREIGARVALGASPARILRMVVGDSIRMAGLGVVIGLAAAFVATRLIAALLFGVGRSDPVAFIVAASAMIVVAGVAGLIPAWRASRVDPLVALRTQ